jgi:hypothetical protein
LQAPTARHDPKIKFKFKFKNKKNEAPTKDFLKLFQTRQGEKLFSFFVLKRNAAGLSSLPFNAKNKKN